LFHELSSGEQQMILTLQTVLYHLNNLQSVRYSKLPRLHYRAINLVFDEIELYFHPAYQRSFINELCLALGRLYVGDEKAIESINMVFLTHSPFILSDIPQANIMLLEVDKDKGISLPKAPKTQTFAANINELLAGSFFLDGTLMGEFAENKVNELIGAVKDEKQLSGAQQRLLNLIGDSYLSNTLKHFLSRRNNDQN
jgi:predicted ATP-binding protein involved in virulence